MTAHTDKLKAMKYQIIVLNGGSSSGKSAITRCLQAILPEPWLALGIDTFIELLPRSLRTSDAGIIFGPGGQVITGIAFQQLYEAWIQGVAAMVRAGARIIVDEVFLAGTISQDPWRSAFEGLDVLWVGVRCDPEVAQGREVARGDRTAGMAQLQAGIVHQGVTYNIEVDTTHTGALEAAKIIASSLT